MSSLVYNDPVRDGAFLATLTEQERNSYYLSTGRLVTDLTGDALFKHYGEFYRAIIDGEIYTTKAVGVKVQSTRAHVPDNPVVTRNIACLESISEVAKHISKLTFVGECGVEFKTTPFTGIGRIPEVKFISNTKEVPTLQTDAYLTQVTREVSIVVVVALQRDVCSVEENYQRLVNAGARSKGFFPFHTDHSLIRDVKVLPFFGRHIFFRTEPGISETGLNSIWESHQRGVNPVGA